MVPEGKSGLRVVVVGAGIVGASIAWHLTRAGARATVIDQSSPYPSAGDPCPWTGTR